MLESEAKTKWCPMARLTAHKGEWHDNRNGMCQFSCIGSSCACWVDTGYNDKAGEREGHCGLAR